MGHVQHGGVSQVRAILILLYTAGSFYFTLFINFFYLHLNGVRETLRTVFPNPWLQGSWSSGRSDVVLYKHCKFCQDQDTMNTFEFKLFVMPVGVLCGMTLEY